MNVWKIVIVSFCIIFQIAIANESIINEISKFCENNGHKYVAFLDEEQSKIMKYVLVSGKIT